MLTGLPTIIFLAFILALGFILAILSAALFHKWLTLLVVATYVIAPIPNWICGRAQSSEDFMDSGNNSIVELGKFMTGFLVVMGIALPVVLAHTDQIRVEAMVMSIIGGLLIYGTFISFSTFFREQEEF